MRFAIVSLCVLLCNVLHVHAGPIFSETHGRYTIQSAEGPLNVVWSHEAPVNTSYFCNEPPNGLEYNTLDLRQNMCSTITQCAGKLFRASANGALVVKGWSVDRTTATVNAVRYFLTADDYAQTKALANGVVINFAVQYPNYWINYKLTSHYKGTSNCSGAQPGTVADALCAVIKRRCEAIQAAKHIQPDGSKIRSAEAAADYQGSAGYGNDVVAVASISKNQMEFGDICAIIGYNI